MELFGTTRWLLIGLASLSLTCALLVGPAPERAAAATDCSLTAPPNVTASNIVNQASAVVFYSAPTTTGTCGTVTCSPASGSSFPIGTTLVTCNTNTSPIVKDRFTIRVNDTQPPTIIAPANTTVSNDAGKASAAVTLATPIVSDNASGVTFTCNHQSGSLFPLGSTTVTCTARDTSGNTSTASFNVIVNDTESPVIERAPDVNATVPTISQGGPVSYILPLAHDNSGTNPVVTCAPASGSTFPVGTTVVTCSTEDQAGNPAAKEFSVVVTRATPPGTEITSGPRARTNSRSAEFEFISTAPGSTFECSLDGGAFEPCTPPESVKVGKGKHSFQVRATDAAGNTDPTPPTRSWTVKKKRKHK